MKEVVTVGGGDGEKLYRVFERFSFFVCVLFLLWMRFVVYLVFFFLLPIETFVKQPSFLVSDDLPFSRRLFFPNSHTNFQEDYDHVIRKLRKK